MLSFGDSFSVPAFINLEQQSDVAQGQTDYAIESSEQQNGLFTYAVLEALDGKREADTDKDGSIEMSELGEYIKKRVAEMTNNKQTPSTRRVNLEGDFTLATTK